MRYEDIELVRLLRPVDAFGLSDDRVYPLPAGTIGTVVTPGEKGCQAEFQIDLPDGEYEYAIASLDAADADPIPRSEWPALVQARESARNAQPPISGAA